MAVKLSKPKPKPKTVAVGQQLGGVLTVSKPPASTVITRITGVKNIRVRYFRSAVDWINVTPRLISIDWEESEQLVSRVFTYTLDNRDGALRSLRVGGVVLIEVYSSGKWSEWHCGTVINDGASRSISEGKWTLRVMDPLRFLGQSKSKLSFAAGRTASQSILATLRKLKFPYGTVAATSRKLGAFTYEGGFYGAFEALLAKEATFTGIRYVQEWSGGKYWLRRYVEPSWVWEMDDAIEAINQSRSIEEGVTSLNLESLSFGKQAVQKTPKSKGKKKVVKAKAKVQASAKYIGQFGLIQVSESVYEPYSPAALKAQTKKKVGNSLRPTSEVMVRFPQAALTVRRLQLMRFVNDPITGVGGTYSIAAISGSVSAEGATMEVRLTRKAAWPELEAPLESPSSTASSDGGGLSISGGDPNGNKAQTAKWMAKLAQEAGLPPELPVMAALQESNLSIKATGDGGKAVGYFQIWPHHIPKGAKGDPRRDPNWQMQWFIRTAKSVQGKKGYRVGDSSRYGEWIANIELPREDLRGKYQPHLATARALIGGGS